MRSDLHESFLLWVAADVALAATLQHLGSKQLSAHVMRDTEVGSCNHAKSAKVLLTLISYPALQLSLAGTNYPQLIENMSHIDKNVRSYD